MRHLWLEHCLRLATDLSRPHHGISCPDIDELRSRVYIKLSRKEFDQLRWEMHDMRQYIRPGMLQTDKITLLGVAFVPDSDEYIRELHHSLERSERSKMHLENTIGMGDRLSRRRLGLGRGVHVAQTSEPGTNRGRST